MTGPQQLLLSDREIVQQVVARLLSARATGRAGQTTTSFMTKRFDGLTEW
jgi:hypothetical protein